MVLWILFISLLSLTFIYIVHNIFIFLKSTLTTPKIRDYIHLSKRSYDEINETLQIDENTPMENTPMENTPMENTPMENTTLIEELTDKERMKYDLKTFLKNQIQS